jgi:hypothetical protein
MKKPCKLELNNSGAWKTLGSFDAAIEDATDAIMNAAEQLAQALNDPACGRPGPVRLRIIADGDTAPLMTWKDDEGWREWRTGRPA